MLSDIKLKKIYDSEHDNLLENFYIPVLKNTVIYKRITGYFSSTALMLAAEGVSYFISNGGKYELICGVELSKNDYDAFRTGIADKEKLLIKNINLEPFDLMSEIERDHLSMLAWLISTNRLVIKIAIMPSNTEGIFHEKIGIFEDKNGNKISFSGSINETGAGWSNNIEEFKVFRNWIEGERDYMERDYNKFQAYWNDKIDNFTVVDLPLAIKDNLLRVKPDQKEFEKILTRLKNTSNIAKRSLYDYQIKAIDNWVNNNYCGILEMATGSGKTLTALGAVKRIYDKYKKYCVIIAVPYKHLVSQWIDDIKTELDPDVIIEAHSGIRGWQTKLTNFLSDYDDGFLNKVVIVVVYDTLSSDNFKKIITNTNRNNIYMLIADEVHNMGAPQNSNAMFSNIKMRLGLSATPARWFDEDGTQKLIEYFLKTVYVYDLKMAIHDHRLTPYDYYPHFVTMSHNEFEEYVELSKRIIKSFNIHRNNDDYLKLLLLKRSKIVKNSVAKIEEFTSILKEMKTEGNVDHLLVYCDSSDQLNEAQQIINGLGIITHKFTQIESIEERKQILTQFDNDIYSCLVAMKCLDEGVNVPSTKTAIILASSTNPREYVQRRGRVLRKYPGKEKAVIHDFVVMPPEKIDDPIMLKLEQQILKKELNRTQEFLDTASNKAYIITSLSKIMLKYHVYLD